MRTFLTGADLVLPDRVASGQTLVIERDRIADLISGPRPAGADEVRIDLTGHVIVPGFIDVHVHGVGGVDVLDGDGAVAGVAQRLPRFGVTAFCPTSTACPPDVLGVFLTEVGRLRAKPDPRSARVLPAHLESNFLNPEYRGAQPLACLRRPADAETVGPSRSAELRTSNSELQTSDPGTLGPSGFSARQVLAAIDAHRPDVAIITLASELEGALALVRAFSAAGVRVSLGHSGATFDQAQEAIAAGARQATHLFNRMRPMLHRDPGLVGAVLASDDLAAELICDGHHVHPAMIRVAVAAKGAGRIMATSDGTAGSGLPAGSRARLGGQLISVGDVARLDDGTMAGSVLTMDRAFACLFSRASLDLVQTAEMCATTPARELGLHGHGVIAIGAVADLAVLDARLGVVQTWIGGQLAFSAHGSGVQ